MPRPTQRRNSDDAEAVARPSGEGGVSTIPSAAAERRVVVAPALVVGLDTCDCPSEFASMIGKNDDSWCPLRGIKKGGLLICTGGLMPFEIRNGTATDIVQSRDRGTPKPL